MSALERVAAFESRFGGAHLDVAAHLALPLSLTTDLAYSIWSYFRRDSNGNALTLPWIAVPDLLLSNLCREVGFELYEIDLDVREVLLGLLVEDARFGESRLRDVAGFLFSYVDRLLESGDIDESDFALVQQLTAVAHIDAADAARALLVLLNGANVDDQGEANLLATTVDALSAGYAGPMAAYPELTAYARALELRARGDVVAASQTMRSTVGDGHLIEVAGLAVRVPRELIVTTREERERRPPYRRPIRFRRLLVFDAVGSSSSELAVLIDDFRQMLLLRDYRVHSSDDMSTNPARLLRAVIDQSTSEDLLLVVVLASNISHDGNGLVFDSTRQAVHLSTLIADLRAKSALRSMVIVCASTFVGVTGEMFRASDGSGDVSVLYVGGDDIQAEPISALRMIFSGFSGDAVPADSTTLTSTDLAAYACDGRMSSGYDPLDVLFMPGRQVLALSEGLTGSMMVDDLDGSTADEEVSFGLDGVRYLIQLNAEHATELRETLARYVEAARRVK